MRELICQKIFSQINNLSTTKLSGFLPSIKPTSHYSGIAKKKESTNPRLIHKILIINIL
jgi:hypothetical protein